MLLDIENIVEFFQIPKKGVFHVGAHHGQEMNRYERMTLPKVVMFEPSKRNFKVLSENLQNKNVKLVNSGLSYEKSVATMHVETANSGMSNSLLNPLVHASQYPHIKFDETENVELTTLDDWCLDNTEFDDCNIMSIDVQGYELEVFLGSQKTLQNVDLIICEVNREELYKDCAFVTEIDVFLRHHNFRRVAVNWEGRTWGDAAYVKESFISKKGMQMPKVNLIDNSFLHSKEVLGFDSSCLLKTSRFDWDREGHGNTDFVVVTDESVTSRVNIPKIAWLIEPRAVSERGYEYVQNNLDEFAAVVSHDIDFLNEIKKGIYCPFGGTWISPSDWAINTKKRKNVSIISSEKNHLEGHKLRHEAAKLLRENDRFGKGYKPISNKIEALKDYRFSVVVENNKANGYFSEKLIDCMMTCTIPIYWGCSEVLQIFDSRGIITFDNIEQLQQILATTDFESFYENAKEHVISNAKKSRRFSSVDETFFSCVLGLQ